MSAPAEDMAEVEEQRQVDWYGVWKRVILIGVLMIVAVVLVVGSQNYEERARVRFLLWSRETRLLTIFLASTALGIVLDESVRRFRSVRRRQNALAEAAEVSGPAGPAAAGPASRSPRR